MEDPTPELQELVAAAVRDIDGATTTITDLGVHGVRIEIAVPKASEFGALVLDGELVFRLSLDGAEHDLGRGLIERELRGVTDLLYAVMNTDIPDGAVFMMRGARRTYGTPVIEAPVHRINRTARTFERTGDRHPRPWPPVTFHNVGREGIVERWP